VGSDRQAPAKDVLRYRYRGYPLLLARYSRRPEQLRKRRLGDRPTRHTATSPELHLGLGLAFADLDTGFDGLLSETEYALKRARDFPGISIREAQNFLFERTASLSLGRCRLGGQPALLYLLFLQLGLGPLGALLDLGFALGLLGSGLSVSLLGELFVRDDADHAALLDLLQAARLQNSVQRLFPRDVA
jgi:hypothetical protein